MKHSTLILVLTTLLAASSSFAQFGVPAEGGFGGGDIPKELVKLSIRFDRADYAPGEKVKGAVEAEIAHGWHINSVKPNNDFSIPTELSVTSPALDVGNIHFPPHIEQAFAFSGGDKLAVYEGNLLIPFDATRKAATDLAVTATMRYQACNDSVCLPPKEVSLVAALGSSAGAVAAPAVGSTSFTPLSEAPAAGSGGLFNADIGATLESRGLLLTLLVVFVLGIALNLTPCVYPLIPITLGYFASQTQGRPSQQIALGSVYVIGIALTYSVLGLFSALSGQLFGGWLQSPAVLIFFAVLMFLLSLSMFGLYEIKVPHFISDRAGARSGYIGALTMGLLAGIVAAPCVGPVVISLIALVSQRGEPLLGFAMFFALALGLGLPYLIGVSSLPRAGAWMVTIKKALGFVLIAMTFYFLRSIVGDRIYYIGVILSLAVGGFYLLADVKRDLGGRVLKLACAIFLLIGSGAFIPSLAATSKTGVAWDRFADGRLDVASRSGNPVVIDFYADWCLPCKELDAKTFKDPAVIAESRRFVRLKADLTRTGDAETIALAKRYSIVGVPTIVFIGSDGREVPGTRLTGFEQPDAFLQRMRGVR